MSRYKKNIVYTRIKFYYFMAVLLFTSLLGRLYYLQVYGSEDLKLNGIKQRSTEISLSSKRGIIYDRNLIPLTNREAIKTIIGAKENILGDEALLSSIKEHTTLTNKELLDILNANEKLLQIPLKREIDISNANNVFIVDIINRYDKSNLLSHVIGYINKSDNKGQSGVERVYDEFLNKTDKASLFIEYNKDRTMVLGGSYYVDNTVESEEPSAVRLTIDYEIQSIVERILDEKNIKGSVIVADVETAEILALGSRPNFDQNNMEKYFEREDMALYNKAIQVSYPPGSIFKLIVLLTALEEDPNIIHEQFYCAGYEQVGSLSIKCSSTHGNISLRNGFAKSCNAVFIQIGKRVGAKKIIEMSKRFGFGEKINIGLMEEIEGILPEGDDIRGPAIGNISIGQGKIEATPLQVTDMLLTVANDGIRKNMTIVQGITNKGGRMIKPYQKNEDKSVISKNITDRAKELLEEVVNSGTARAIDLDSLGGAAGKTGSAEGLLKGKPTVYGWFGGYYPKDHPKYVITVLVEEANSGSSSAAPIFEAICKEIFYRSQ